MLRLALTLLFAWLPYLIWAQTQPGLFSGPMIGEVTPKTARIWVQTEAKTDVSLSLVAPVSISNPIRGEYRGHNMYHFKIHGLLPDTKHAYQLHVGEKTTTHSVRTAPEPNSYTDIRFAAGSCKLVTGNMYKDPRRSKRNKYKIYTHIAALEPKLMLWMGDYVYMRKDDHGDTARVYRRYAFNRALPSMQPLLQTSANLAILDDHEFGPDDSDSSFIHKALNQQAFKDYWPNGRFGEATGDGLERHYRYDDLDFFLTDTRSKRANPQLSEGTIDPNAGALKRKRMAKKYLDKRTGGQSFGPEQIQWLIEGLQASDASFKFVVVGGQLLNNSEKTFYGYNSNLYHAARHECDALLGAIDSLEIRNVVFLTGDRHYSESFIYHTPRNDIRVIELTYSGLSSPNFQIKREKTDRRVEGSYFGKKNFGVVEVIGPKGKRQLVAKTYNKRGKLKRKYSWEQE